MATPNQIVRAMQHKLFGEGIEATPAFDLHILLVNFNDRGEKGPLIELTRQLATAFSNRLKNDHREVAGCLGNILCISGHIEDETECFSSLTCRWMV